MYKFLSQYQNYLLYEKLSPESRMYNQLEQTIFIINALKHDVQLRPGLKYVASNLQASKYYRIILYDDSYEIPKYWELINISSVTGFNTSRLRRSQRYNCLWQILILVLVVLSLPWRYEA